MFEQVIKEASALPRLAPEAAQDYDQHKSALAEHVNESMDALRNINQLVGQNPLRVMHMNHANHAMFLANVLKLNDFELLARVVPWVYRAYHSRGFSYDYFPLALRAWQAAARKHLAPASAEAVLPVYEWMVSKHEAMVRLAEDKSYVTVPAGGMWNDQAQPFLSALLKGDRAECLAIAERIAPTSAGLPDLYVRIIQPAMYRVGTLWETNDISVAQEHLATSLVSRVMAAVYHRLEGVEVTRGLAVVAATPEEFHETGTRMVADLLELDGWQVTYLGANTPAEDIRDCVIDSGADILALSASMPFNIDKVAAVVADIHARPVRKPLKIMAGGIAFWGIPRLWEGLGADGYAPDAEAAAALARQWWGESANR